MVNDLSDSERENPLLSLHGLFFSIRAARDLLFAPSGVYRQDSTYNGDFVTPDVEHWLEREIARGVHYE